MTKKIVMAWSGAADAAVLLKWLKEKHSCPVVAFVADLGQSEDMGAVSRKAMKAGADKVVLLDLREDFARDYVFTALKANAVDEGAYLMGAALARPLLAKVLIKVAKSEQGDALAHDASGRGNDRLRFELACRALAPELEILSPWRSGDFSSRGDYAAYAAKHGIELGGGKPCLTDANLMHVRYEGGPLEDPWQEPAKEMFLSTKDPGEAPDQPESVEIEFVDGCPVALNREQLSPAKLLLKLNGIAGRHGVGRVDVVESRLLGTKSRGVYETPGVSVLHLAHRAVESVAMDREVLQLRDGLVPKFAALIYNGLWFSPEFQVLRALVEESQRNLHGTARIKLYKGRAAVVGRKSPISPPPAEDGAGDDARDAEGYIRLNGLRLSLNKSLRRAL